MKRILLFGFAAVFAALLFGCIGGGQEQGLQNGMGVQQAVPQKCVATMKDGSVITYYFDGKGNMRAESNQDGESTVLIYKEGVQYMKINGNPQCDWTSTQLDEEGESEGIAGLSNVGYMETGGNLKMECTNMPVDESMFTPSGKVCSLEDMLGGMQ